MMHKLREMDMFKPFNLHELNELKSCLYDYEIFSYGHKSTTRMEPLLVRCCMLMMCLLLFFNYMDHFLCWQVQIIRASNSKPVA